MEIHIQLAGIELGPYSEKQVRDYLQEELLSLSDPARFDGTDKWQTVEEILAAQSMPAAPAPAPVTIEAPKAPEPIPVITPSPMATGTMPLPKPALRKTAGITTSLLPVPKQLSKDTIRVPIPQLNKSAAQQVTPVKKAIPMVPQPPAPKTESAAKSSEKARTSLLTAVKILAKKTDPEAGTPVAPPLKPSTPSTQPIAFPKSTETRTMPMSVVRAISKKADLDEKPGVPVEISLTKRLKPTADSVPLPRPIDPDRASPLSAPKAPIKKSEPEQVVETPLAPTALDASNVSAKLPQTVRTVPMSPVRALPRKKESDAKTASPAEAVRFIPGNTPLPPGSVAKASPVSPTAFSGKLLKRTTGSLPTLVKVLEKKPDEVVPAPTVQEKEIKPPSTAELPGEPGVEEETGEPKPSFFQALAGKLGTLFKSKTPAEPEVEPGVETKPEVAEAPEIKPEIEEKNILTKDTTILKDKQEIKDKLASKEKLEPFKKPELKKSVVVEAPKPLSESKPLLGLKSLPPAPEGEDEEPLSRNEELLAKEIPVPVTRSVRASSAAIFAIIAFILAVGCACGAYFYVQYSHQAAASLLQALRDGDQAQLQKLVDFPSVRKTLANQVMAQASRSGAQDADSRTAIVAMNKSSIDYYVTPEAISALVMKSALPPAGPDPVVKSTRATDILNQLIALPIKSQGLIAYDHYVIDLDAAKLDLMFIGSAWKLTEVEINFDFKLPVEAGSQATPVDLGSSMAEPVIETYFDDGNAKFKQGDLDGAIADFNRVLDMNPTPTIQGVAYSNRGMAKAAKGEVDEAIADFNQVISLDPTMAEAYENRGDAKSVKKDIDGAIADYSQAINLNPKLADAFYKRGTSRTVKGDYEGAIADFTQDIALDPNNAKAFSNRGYVRKAQKDLDGAISDFTQALAIDPKIVGAYFNRGSAKYEKADLDGAIADFNSALDLDPKMTRGYYSRGIAKNTKNDLDGAVADYNQALALDPNLVPALNDRALVRQAKGDLKGALDDYNRALTLDPKLGNAYYARGLIKEQLNDLDGAIADSSRALDLDPKRAQAYYNRGFAKLVKGNLEGAKSDLQKFCELASKDPYADHARLYLWLIEMGQSPTNTANLELSDALQNNWSLAPDDLVTKIAQFLLDRESEADLVASAASSDAQKDAGHHCEVWYFAGMKRLLAGDKATAIDYFHKCLATGQKDYCEYILAQAELQILAPNP